jgi:hypothetical protein
LSGGERGKCQHRRDSGKLNHLDRSDEANDGDDAILLMPL